MKKLILVLTFLFLVSAFFSCGVIFKKGPDITGTWKGPLIASIAPDEDYCVLTFKKENGKYTGTITEDFGYLVDVPLKEIKLEDNTLTFTYDFEAQGMTINSILTIEGNKMTGTFQTTDGSVTGTYDLKKAEE